MRYGRHHIKNTASNSSSVVARVFFAARKCLLSRCLAAIRGFIQTHIQEGDLIPILLFPQNEESRLKSSNKHCSPDSKTCHKKKETEHETQYSYIGNHFQSFKFV
jgi:hypothetical protein